MGEQQQNKEKGERRPLLLLSITALTAPATLQANGHTLDGNNGSVLGAWCLLTALGC